MIQQEQQVLGWTRDSKGNIVDRHPVDVANTVTAAPSGMLPCHGSTTRTRIRRLTERELFRLMDVDEPDIDTLLNAGIPRTQLAKMAGNSIVVGVLYHIFRTLLVDTEAEPNTQMKLF